MVNDLSVITILYRLVNVKDKVILNKTLFRHLRDFKVILQAVELSGEIWHLFARMDVFPLIK